MLYFNYRENISEVKRSSSGCLKPTLSESLREFDFMLTDSVKNIIAVKD